MDTNDLIDNLMNNIRVIADGIKVVKDSLPVESEMWQDKSVRLAFEDAERAIRQFDCRDKMIVVTCGMLKAGKSTLINLLSRSNMASPVGFGIDTTLRPAIIRMSESREGCIRLYYAEGNEEKHKKAQNQVFDQIRGLKLVEKAKYNEEKIELTAENLRDCLCMPVDGKRILKQEPLLIVVETPQHNEPCLLSNKIMLLDMPGLDSGNAEVVSKAIDAYADLVDECDMLFFVQSSVSPLNRQAKDLLVKVLKKRNPATTFIIQNRMEAQVWRKKERQDFDQSRQAQKAREDVLECFRSNNRGDKELECVRIETMNLGMAYDAMVHSGKEEFLNTEGMLPDGSPISCGNLKKLSDFHGFEDRARKVMCEKGLHLRMCRCAEILAKRIECIQEAIKGVKTKSLEPMLSEADSVLNAWGRVKDALELLEMKSKLSDYCHIQEVLISDDCIKKLSEQLGNVWNDARDTDPDYFREFGNNAAEVKGSIIDKFLNKCSDIMAERTNEYLKECLLNQILVKSNKGIQSITEFLNAALKGVFEQCTAKNHDKECTDQWRALEDKASPAYEYGVLRIGEYKTIIIQRREPSENEGRGYSFYKRKDYLGKIPIIGRRFEEKSLIKTAKECFDKTIKEYCNDVMKRIAENGEVWAKDFFNNGMKKGLEGTFAFVEKKAKEALRDYNKKKEECDIAEKCLLSMGKLEKLAEGIEA